MEAGISNRVLTLTCTPNGRYKSVDAKLASVVGGFIRIARANQVTINKKNRIIRSSEVTSSSRY